MTVISDRFQYDNILISPALLLISTVICRGALLQLITRFAQEQVADLRLGGFAMTLVGQACDGCRLSHILFGRSELTPAQSQYPRPASRSGALLTVLHRLVAGALVTVLH